MESLNKQRPFKSAGDDFAETNPIFSYYFYKYFLEAAVNIYKDLQDHAEKTQLTLQLKQLQVKMQGVKDRCGTDLNQEKNMGDILQYTQAMFAKNDHAYRQGTRNKQIAQDFLTLSRMYEIVGKFGKLDQQQNKRKAYSKKKFIEIMKELKTNPQKESFQMPPPPPVIQQQIKKSVFKQEVLPKPSKLISFNKIEMQMQASKALQNAVSELSFDRFKFAREQALRALDILDQLCE